MPNKQSNVAILIFANSSSKETKRKNLFQEGDFFDYLNKKIIQKAKKTSFDVVLFDETSQKGNTFGERFTNAVETTFTKGYQKVIAIGNDSPDLKVNHLKETFTKLENQQSVLGPSLDGGAYLIALDKNLFNKQQFLELPWQTNLLFTALRKLLAQSTKVTQLPYLKDIDNLNDLKTFLFRFNTSKELQLIIKSITPSLSKTFYYLHPILTIGFTTNLFNKGSPLHSSF